MSNDSEGVFSPKMRKARQRELGLSREAVRAIEANTGSNVIGTGRFTGPTTLPVPAKMPKPTELEAARQSRKLWTRTVRTRSDSGGKYW